MTDQISDNEALVVVEEKKANKASGLIRGSVTGLAMFGTGLATAFAANLTNTASALSTLIIGGVMGFTLLLGRFTTRNKVKNTRFFAASATTLVGAAMMFNAAVSGAKLPKVEDVLEEGKKQYSQIEKKTEKGLTDAYNATSEHISKSWKETVKDVKKTLKPLGLDL